MLLYINLRNLNFILRINYVTLNLAIIKKYQIIEKWVYLIEEQIVTGKFTNESLHLINVILKDFLLFDKAPLVRF